MLNNSQGDAPQPIGDQRPRRVMFAYWGRRGALSRFALDLAHAAVKVPNLEPIISIARSNELFDQFAKFNSVLLPVDTFSTATGAARLDKLLKFRQQITQEVRRRKVDAVVALMPHVWAPFIISPLRASGCRYAVISHDASPHPGDMTAIVNRWLMNEVRRADMVITLSQAVAGRLSARGIVDWHRIYPLFHPDFNYGPQLSPKFPAPGKPFRLLSFGRLLEYKALPMLLDAMDILREDGIAIELGVYGEGNISSLRERLANLRVEVQNKWIADSELRTICQNYHAMVLSHVEASQSGVVAAAHGLGLPVIVTPVGGLPEQVRNMQTGMVTEHADAFSLSQAIAQLAQNRELYERIHHHILQTAEDRSMERFVKDLVAHVCYARH